MSSSRSPVLLTTSGRWSTGSVAYARPKRSEFESPEMTVLLMTVMARGSRAAEVPSPPTKMPTYWPA